MVQLGSIGTTLAPELGVLALTLTPYFCTHKIQT